MTVFINKEGFLCFDSGVNVTAIEISEETWNTISFCKKFHNWKYENGEWCQICIDKNGYLRDRRTKICFNILDNRSTLWYNNLTSDQLEELNNWYQDWLNVTDTEIIPETPIWLK